MNYNPWKLKNAEESPFMALLFITVLFVVVYLFLFCDKANAEDSMDTLLAASMLRSSQQHQAYEDRLERQQQEQLRQFERREDEKRYACSECRMREEKNPRIMCVVCYQ